MRILAVGAHPDDIEISCAGTLAKYSKQGHVVGMAVMTDGSNGHTTIEPKKLVELRKEEAEKSASMIGAKLFWIGLPDGKLDNNVETRIKVIKVIRVFDPDIIITHSTNDYLSDHRITGQLVIDAGSWANVAYLMPQFKATNRVPIVLLMDPLAGVDFIPERYVDISEVIKIKQDMLLCHKTQYEWMKKFGRIDYLDLVNVSGRYRGMQSGVEYAEGFKVLNVWLSVVPEPILP